MKICLWGDIIINTPFFNLVALETKSCFRICKWFCMRDYYHSDENETCMQFVEGSFCDIMQYTYIPV